MEAIAESTKIRRSLLLALETGDLSKLPGGIFQRAFVRAYAEAVGLAPDELLTDLSQLCPESIGGLVRPASGAGRMRLTLEPAAAWEAAPVRRGLAAVGDTGAILVAAGAIASVTAVNPWAVLGLVGIGYYTFATALLGRSPMLWYLERGASFRLDGDHLPDTRPWPADLVRRSVALIATGSDGSRPAPPADQPSAHSQAARP